VALSAATADIVGAVGHPAQQPFGDAWLRREILLTPSHSVSAVLDNQYGVTGVTFKALDLDDLKLPNLGHDFGPLPPNAYAASSSNVRDGHTAT
jgi:hypothetical protein